jgi:hypothetical protein
VTVFYFVIFAQVCGLKVTPKSTPSFKEKSEALVWFDEYRVPKKCKIVSPSLVRVTVTEEKK